jgi:hypothetical protein
MKEKGINHFVPNGKWHKERRHNSICLKPERGIKERGIISF